MQTKNKIVKNFHELLCILIVLCIVVPLLYIVKKINEDIKNMKKNLNKIKSI